LGCERSKPSNRLAGVREADGRKRVKQQPCKDQGSARRNQEVPTTKPMYFCKTSCNPRRAAPRDGNLCRKHLLGDEFIIAFPQKASPQAMSSGCSKIGRRHNGIGTPTRGAPNVTQAVSSRTIVAGMMENVTNFEQLQNERI
jgi:hypothetical protein